MLLVLVQGSQILISPKNIIDAAIRAMEEGKTKYTPTAGIIELREAICNKLEKVII